MALRIVFADPNASADYRRKMTGVLNAIAKACSLATRASAKLIEQRGRQDIASAGRFGARWQEGLTAVAEPKSGFFINNTITVGHDQVGARLFEFGGEVQGRPLLWIPLSFADPKARAKNYPGGLFRVNRKAGKPLLLSIRDRKPKFVGVASVKIPQKFHIRDISADVIANDFVDYYNRYLDIPNG